MSSSFDHANVDAKWQANWRKTGAFETPKDREKPKYYVLDMFPYPSGSGLHVGHPKGYVATDVVARAKRMMGFNVMRVMGWDSFGLPAERQAVREKKHPRDITTRNIETFKNQLSTLGLSYDWSRELATSDAKYYKWTQWIFLKLYEKGLAYQAEVAVNWCPALGTVLANEEVKDGVYVETGDPVEKRMMKQWMLRITEYSERLLADLDTLDWPEGIIKQQADWIGKSTGADILFSLKGFDDAVEVYTTRPDTLFGCACLVLAPEHPLVAQITSKGQSKAVAAYIDEVGKKSDRDRTSAAVDEEKTGVFTGAFAINPVNGKEVPVWIADYVLASYGTGAVFVCPAHDERDYIFAKCFELPIVEVVKGGDIATAAYTGDGPHVNSDFLDGLRIEEAKEKVISWLDEKSHGKKSVRYKLRDWLFSRQRYWGEPFPLITKADGTVETLPEGDLPVLLPELSEFTPTADGEPPLARAEEWVKTTDSNGKPALRETNTMPQWAGSCWYYLRFISPALEDAAWDESEEKYWMPVDLYVGGAEHAVLHLLYARFWHKVLYDLGLVSTIEPFQRLFNQGMIHATSYKDKRGKYYYPEQIEQKGNAFIIRESGEPVETSREKMSKSRYNVVNPNDMCSEYGADALRLYELFMGPLEDGNDWDTGGVQGTKRFLDRVWRLGVDPETDSLSAGLVEESKGDAELERLLHSAIKKVTEAVAELRFNTAISEMMVFVNAATKAKDPSGAKALPKPWFENFVKILSPFAPHVAEELWERLGHTEGLVYESWPTFDESKLAVSTMTLAVQIGGKTRGSFEIAADASKEEIIEAAKQVEKIPGYLEGKTIHREIYVPGRLVNIVAK